MARCDRCEGLDVEVQLTASEGGATLRLCRDCLGVAALFSASDERTRAFLESLAQRGGGAVWREGERAYLIRDPGAGPMFRDG